MIKRHTICQKKPTAESMEIISMGGGAETDKALTLCQRASSSTASGSSAWVGEEKMSRHLHPDNRQAAAKHQDDQHGSRRRKCQGTYVLTTGKQQQGIRIISMVRRGEIVEALTCCQQASSSKASGSSAWFDEEKSSRHLLPVNRRAAARHQDHQHGSTRRNRPGTYPLSTGEQQQGIRIISMVRRGEIVQALTLCQQANSSKASGSSAWFDEEKSSRHLLPVNRRAAARHQDHQHGSTRRNRPGTYLLSTGEQQQGIRIISMVRRGEIVEALTSCQQASSSKASGSSAWFDEEKSSRHLQAVNMQAAARHQDHQHGSTRRNRPGTYPLSTGEQQQGIRIISMVRRGEIVEALTSCQQASSSKASGSSAWFDEEKSSKHLPSVNRRAAARHQDHQHGSTGRNRRGTYFLSTGEQQQGIRIISMVRRGEIVEALTHCQQASSSKASGSSAWFDEEKSSRHLPSVNRRAAARHQDHQHGSTRRNRPGTYPLSTGEQQQGIRIISMVRRGEIVEALTSCQQASTSKASGSSAWFDEEKSSRHLPTVNRRAAARHQDHQHGSTRRNRRGTYFLSTGEQQQGIRIISMVRRGEIVQALTCCQQASSSKASGSSAWFDEEKSSKHLPSVNRRAPARHQDHQHGSTRRNRPGTYPLSTGEQQQGIRIISMVRRGEIVEALTSCQQASSSKASGSSAWFDEEKSSRHLLAVNRRAAARHQDHQHGSTRRNRRGTYFLSTGEQQQGIRIISMVRRGEIVQALTHCQQASSSKASGSSAWFDEEKSSRHIRPVNRRAAARHQDHQHGSTRRNRPGTYFLSTGEQQQGIRIISMVRRGEIVEALTSCQQASSSKASGSSAWFDEEKSSRHLPSVNRRAAARHQDHQHGSTRRNRPGTYPLSTGEQQQGIRIISMVRRGEIVEALTSCQQASTSKASGSSAWFDEEKSSRHLPTVNRRAAARHQDHQHGSTRRNRRGTYFLSTGEHQQGIRIISMVRRGEIVQALTCCQQASSSKASGSSAWFDEEKSSKHLPSVNRRAAARHQDHQHGSTRRNRRGTYPLSTGEQQQGIRIISMVRRGEIVQALTHCQQASSSKASGSSAWFDEEKSSRHLRSVNRQAVARRENDQHGSTRKHSRGTYPLSTCKQQQTISIVHTVFELQKTQSYQLSSKHNYNEGKIQNVYIVCSAIFTIREYHYHRIVIFNHSLSDLEMRKPLSYVKLVRSIIS
ncbi:hypothetical protein EDB19DRAFT_1833056 [Suillus lakei]|nr:hypothetical protein EDB19DRAFT_1833056 [Suillus lakei]